MERVIKQGLDGTSFYLDSRGARVEVESIDLKSYLRRDVSKPWEEMNEIIPKETDASMITSCSRMGSGMVYEIEYFKIKK